MALEMSEEEVLFRDGKSKVEIELDTYKGLPRPDFSNTDILKSDVKPIKNDSTNCPDSEKTLGHSLAKVKGFFQQQTG